MIKLINREVTQEDNNLINKARNTIRALQQKEDEVFHKLLQDLNLEIGPEDDRAPDYDYLFDYVYNNIFFEPDTIAIEENES